MAITAWNPPAALAAGLNVSPKLITTAKQTNARPIRVLTRKTVTFVPLPRGSSGGGGGVTVPTTGQIWPRGTTSKTS